MQLENSQPAWSDAAPGAARSIDRDYDYVDEVKNSIPSLPLKNHPTLTSLSQEIFFMVTRYQMYLLLKPVLHLLD